MKFTLHKTIVLLAISIISIAAGQRAGSAQAVKGAGAISSISGDVETRQGEGPWAAAKLNDTLDPGDGIRTGSGGKAKIVMPNGSTIVLGQLSSLTIDDMDIDYGADSSSYNYTLGQGAARATTPKSKSQNATFTVKTPTAVAGVRGTDFAVEIDEEETTLVTVFDGEVEVGDILESLKEKILVTKDHASETRRGGLPEKPKALDKDKLKEKMQRLSRFRNNDRPGADETASDEGARAASIARANNLPGGQRDKLVSRVQDGDITPDQAEKILAAGNKNGNPELSQRILDAITEKSSPPGAADKMAALIDKGADEQEIGKQLEAIRKENAQRADAQAKRKELLDSMDKKKVDEAIGKLGAGNPRRKELALIREAIEKGIPRERLDLLLGALDKGLIDDREARILIKALAKNIDQKDLITAIRRLKDIKADHELRALVFKAVADGVDIKSVFEKLQASGLTPAQIKERLAAILKAKLTGAQPPK